MMMITMIKLILIAKPQAYRYQVSIESGLFLSHGQVQCSLALVGNHLKMVSL